MDQDQFISVTDAAKRLGVHRNTILLRCEKGIYDYEWSDGPKGRQKWVRLSSLDGSPQSPRTQDKPAHASSPQVMPANASPAILSVLSPILEQMRADAAENGMLKERVRTLEDQIKGYQQAARDTDMSRPWWRKLFRP
jgi:hypothetical protein